MSILAFLGGRYDKKAWGRALFAAGCKLPAKPDTVKYDKATERIINEDCRAIQSCAKSIASSKSPAVRSRQKMLMLSRYDRLLSLERYASRTQRRRIREMRPVVAKARRYK